MPEQMHRLLPGGNEYPIPAPALTPARGHEAIFLAKPMRARTSPRPWEVARPGSERTWRARSAPCDTCDNCDRRGTYSPCPTVEAARAQPITYCRRTGRRGHAPSGRTARKSRSRITGRGCFVRLRRPFGWPRRLRSGSRPERPRCCLARPRHQEFRVAQPRAEPRMVESSPTQTLVQVRQRTDHRLWNQALHRPFERSRALFAGGLLQRFRMDRPCSATVASRVSLPGKAFFGGMAGTGAKEQPQTERPQTRGEQVSGKCREGKGHFSKGLL